MQLEARGVHGARGQARVIYEGDQDGIINEYIQFCRIFNEQTKIYGMTREAVERTIKICKDKNVLREYLATKEKEVTTIMMSLFDDEVIIDLYAENRAMDAAKEAAREATKTAERNLARSTAEMLIRDNKLSLDDIARYFPSLTPDDIHEIRTNAMQMA